MLSSDRRGELPEVIRILNDRLGSEGTCSDLIDGYEVIIGSVWTFTARLLGDAGAKAVVVHSVQLATSDAPLLQRVRIGDDGRPNFAELRDYAAGSCSTMEVLDTLLRLGVMIFQTLSDLAGDAITAPLLSHLEKKSWCTTNVVSTYSFPNKHRLTSIEGPVDLVEGKGLH